MITTFSLEDITQVTLDKSGYFALSGRFHTAKVNESDQLGSGKRNCFSGSEDALSYCVFLRGTKSFFMKRLCVFCGSSSGMNPLYREHAAELGRTMALSGIEVVYGGGNVGLMGILANSALDHGGRVTGIIPKSIAELEIAHLGLTSLEVVNNMHERKNRMGELAEGFIALPGGFGTLDELAEVLTYNQLRIYDKPVGLLNVNGYFDGLLQFFDHCVAEGFVRQEHRKNILVAAGTTELLTLMEDFEPVAIGKWIDDIRQESNTN
jgi:uncharacterized protein (TIGR00730 family)